MGSAARIAIIEDDADIRAAISTALTDHGYRTATFADGRRAYDALCVGERPDLIVLDLMMPEMDGWEFRSAQKRNPGLADVPVLVVSANDTPAATAIDAAICLRKPISLDQLLDAVSTVITTHELRAAPVERAEAERFDALVTLAAGVAHEINNPLQYVLTNLQLIVEELSSADARRHESIDGDASHAMARRDELLRVAASQSLHGIERIAAIVRDLRAFSGETEARVVVNKVVASCVRLRAADLESRATLVSELGVVPDVMANTSGLGQIVVSLLTNAAQACEGKAGAREVRVRTMTGDDGAAILEVADTGCGIPPELLGRVFEPFFTTRDIGKGSGLGLAIARKITRSFGGRIEIRSEVGAGTTVRVVLPPKSARDPDPDRAGKRDSGAP